MYRPLMVISILFFTVIVSGQEIQKTDILPELVVKGQGEINLLLIPCMSCRWNEWEEFMSENLNNYTMYAVTIPGFGGTPVPNIPKNTNETPWRENALNGLSALIDYFNITDVVVVGHSWGSMLAIQLAARRQDAVRKVISVDGTIESTSWTPETKEEKLEQAQSVINNWQEKLKDAEEWRKFNGTGGLPKKDALTRKEALQAIRTVGSFMATDRDVVLQYWRENHLVDLTSALHQITVPILDIQSFSGDNQQEQKKNYLQALEKADIPTNVMTVFMFDTRHFIMFERPKALNNIIFNFIMGESVQDYYPNQ